MRAIILIAAGMLTATILVAAEQSPTARDRDADWVAPARADGLMNPLANRPDTEAGGRKLFHQRCATCHGEDARGTSHAPNLTAAGVQAQSDGALFWKISSGNTRTGMPTFSFLPELQRWQLVLHLRSRARQRGVD